MVNNQSIYQSYNWVGAGNLSKARQQSKGIQIRLRSGANFSKVPAFGVYLGYNKHKFEKENVSTHLTLKVSCFGRTCKHTLSRTFKSNWMSV